MERDFGLTVVVGAGALGAMYAERIVASGLDVVFYAEGERKERIQRNGVVVNGVSLTLPVVSEVDRWPERIIVALKDQHLREFLAVLPGICGPDTTVMSVMNGIDSEPLLIEALGEAERADTSRVLYCMVAGMDAVRAGGDVRYTRLGVVSFGRRRNGPGRAAAGPDRRVEAMGAFLAAAQIPAESPADMEKAIWNKFMLNVGINQWSAVLGAPYGVFHTVKEARDLMRRAMEEVLEIARSRDIDLTRDDLERWFEVVNTLSPEGKTSMLQDVEAGRKTEVEMFAGRVVAMGREAGVATPVNAVLFDAIRTLEAMGR